MSEFNRLRLGSGSTRPIFTKKICVSADLPNALIMDSPVAKPRFGLSSYEEVFADKLVMYYSLKRNNFICTRAFLTFANFKLYCLTII
jgi:hypothetical protein